MTRIRSGLSWASTKKEERESGSWKVVALASRLLLNQRVKDQACPTLYTLTGSCRKTIPEREFHLPFVTFAFFCSNSLCFLLCAVKDQSLANVTRSNGNLTRGHLGTPVLVTLCYLCFLLFNSLCFLLCAVKDQSLSNVTRSNGKLSKDHPGTRVPFALCYLCFLLFKFSLLPSVRHNFRGLHR